MIEVAPQSETATYVQNEDEAPIMVDDEEDEAEKTLIVNDEPESNGNEEDMCRVASTSSNSPPIDPSNTGSSSRSSAVRDSPRIQLSPGSPCTSTSFSLPSSNRRSATPSSETEGGLKLPQSIDGTSSGLSPTSTSSSSFASINERRASLQVGLSSDGSDPSGRKLSQAAIEKRHICDVCGKAFPYLSILESHKRCHTGERPFACSYCDKSFSQKATLQVHERTHTGERPYVCKFCPKRFAQYGTKTVHEKSSHLGVRNYKCPVCAKCLSSPSALYTHKKTHGDKVFSCPHCPKTFTLKNYLKLHVRQVHQQNDRRHVCKFCDKSFSYAGSLQVHLRTHTGERPYQCRHCSKAFASQGNLQSHERTHTNERPFQCSRCPRSFIQKSQLTSHEATHLNASSDLANTEHMLLSTDAINAQLSSLSQSPPTLQDQTQPQSQANKFSCQYCGKVFAYQSSLYVHVRLHTGIRPFVCEYCQKSFTSQGNLIVHLRSHTGERPFVCNCGKAYAQKVGLKIHQEQCQMYLHRRGSVVTIGTNESDSSPSLADDDYVVVDEDKEPNFFLNAPVKPQPISMPNAQQLFSPTASSQRESFSSDVFFPGTPLLSPTVMPNQQQAPLPQLPLLNDQHQLDSLARLVHNGLKLPMLPNQNELLFQNPATTTAQTANNNNNYKDSLNNLLIEQQLIQNLQKLQQLLQAPAPTMPNNNLLNGLLNMPLAPQATSLPQPDLLAQLQLNGNFNSLLQSVLPLPPPQQPNNLTASLAAALNDLARQNSQAAPQMFIGN